MPASSNNVDQTAPSILTPEGIELPIDWPVAKTHAEQLAGFWVMVLLASGVTHIVILSTNSFNWVHSIDAGMHPIL